ncbi:hypothetical protein CLOM_g5782 [Closterium sp. NIES-68]|nr:hypothetical protein CLOM_g5782 [Closterium sp. NIES-68]GJP73834.1 hypothetical protein CLOP_g4513 [Closterium sp. NIES-67]
MSDRSNISASARNPLYGGPSNKSFTPNRTPSWAYKNGGDAGDGSDQGSPTASPLRSHRSHGAPSPYYAPQYENPGYTVETPGLYDPYMNSSASFHGSHLYRPTETYFVQTPAHSMRSARVNESPESSAPSSPQHADGYAEMGGGKGFGKDGEEAVFDDSDHEEEFYPDIQREKFRKRRFRQLFCVSSLLVVAALVVAGCIIAWVVYQPTPPTYTMDYALVNQFQTFPDMLDGNGLPTDQLYANLTLILSIRNPNTRYVSWFDGGDVRIGYSSINTIMRGKFPKFKQNRLEWNSFNGSASTMAFPLYGGGMALRSDMAEQYVPLVLNATLRAHVDVVWKVVSPQYTHMMECIVNINPLAMQYINDTCTVTQI